jgi:CheY-like chemotaxis protein
VSDISTTTTLGVPTILLAEDSDDDAFFFQRALKKTCLACSFVRAANGKLAIELLEKEFGKNGGEGRVPNLFFLDLKMPVMSGFEVLEWLKTANINPPLKVIVLSGSNDHADRLRAAALGASGYLVKPITPGELINQLGMIAEASPNVGVQARCAS